MQSSSSIQLQAKPTILTYQAYQAKPTTPKTSTSQAHGHGWLGWLVAISVGEQGGIRVYTVWLGVSLCRIEEALG
jgi:hypothetical protein